MNKVKSETCGEKSTLMQQALALALALTPPRDVSAAPRPGSWVGGCSYTDFRAVVLIDTCW